jgi:hypothetical protein
MWSVPRLYNEEQLRLSRSLETAVRRVGGWCEMAASLRGSEPGSRGTSTCESTEHWEDLVRAVVNRRVCELTIALELLVVTSCKWSINPITKSKHRPYSPYHVTIPLHLAFSIGRVEHPVSLIRYTICRVKSVSSIKIFKKLFYTCRSTRSSAGISLFALSISLYIVTIISKKEPNSD